MVAENVLKRIPWKKVVEELVKATPYIAEKLKDILEKRRAEKVLHDKNMITGLEERFNAMDNDFKLLENNVTMNSEAVIKMQDQINLITAGMNSFNLRQNILIGLSIGAVIMSVLSLVAIIIK